MPLEELVGTLELSPHSSSVTCLMCDRLRRAATCGATWRCGAISPTAGALVGVQLLH